MLSSLKSMMPWNQAPGSAGLRISPFALSWFNKFEVKGASHRENALLLAAKEDIGDVITLLDNDQLTEGRTLLKASHARLVEVLGE